MLILLDPERVRGATLKKKFESEGFREDKVALVAGYIHSNSLLLVEVAPVLDLPQHSLPLHLLDHHRVLLQLLHLALEQVLLELEALGLKEVLLLVLLELLLFFFDLFHLSPLSFLLARALHQLGSPSLLSYSGVI
jgi:hypothetical protein